MSREKKTAEEQLSEAMERISQLEKQAQRQNVAKFDEGTEVRSIGHIVEDKYTPKGIAPGLATFYAARQEDWKTHPHNEAWARRNGYRKAEAGDFVKTDDVSPQDLLARAEAVSGDHVLYICPKDHQERRRHDAVRRSAIACDAPLPEFRGPDGDATVKEPGNGTS